MRRHTIVVRPDNNGDVLLAGPAIRAVAHGSEQVTLWVGPRGRAAAALLPGVDHIVCWELPWIDLAPDPVDRAWLDETVDLLERLEADAAVVLSSFHQSPLPTALLLRAAGVGFVAATSVDHPGALLDVRHRISDDVHEVERSLSLVRSAGFELPTGDDASLRVRDLGAVDHPMVGGGRYVVLHPGASVPARAWAPEHNAELVALLVDAGWRVAVTGGPGETELTAQVAGGHPGALDLGGRTDWPTLARLVAEADALVTGNTGPAHLAAAVGTPVVELFAPVVPAVRWRPWQVPQVLLGEQDIACAGCRARICPVEGHPCIDEVGAPAVAAALHELVGTPDRREVRT